MKKFYTVMLSAIVALSASAGLNLRHSIANKATRANIQLENTKVTPSKFEGTTILKTSFVEKKEEAARIKPIENWVDVKTVKYTDDLMTGLIPEEYADLIPELTQTMEVQLQQLEGSETNFRLVNPYKNWESFFEDVKVDDSKDYYMNFMIEDDLVVVKSGELGILVATNEEMTEFESMSFFTQASELYTQVPNFASLEAAIPGICGTYEGGIVEYPAFCTSQGKNYLNFVLYIGALDDNMLIGGNMNGNFRIVIDSDAADYSIKMTTETDCVTEDTFQATLTFGADVASAKGLFYPGGWFSASVENFSYIEDQLGEYLFDVPTESGTYNIPAITEQDGPATFFLLGYDSNGNRVKGIAYPMLVCAENAAEWKTIGTAEYTDDLMASIWVDQNKNPWNCETYNVDIQEKITQPGFYRLVNPYTSPDWFYTPANSHAGTPCNHYLYIDASNPNEVVIPFSFVGFESTYGHEIIVSENYLMETPEPELYGKMIDDVITFPANSILETTLTDVDENGEQNFYPVNVDGKFKVVLKRAGINDAVIDLDSNAPVEYFNLQGVRVANPAAGELVIKRQGANVSKTVIR